MTDGFDRRRDVRIQSINLIQYSSQQPSLSPEEDPVYQDLGLARTIDISVSGCKIHTSGAIPAGLELAFDLQLRDTVVRCRGQIARLIELADGGWEAGIEFIDLSVVARSAIEVYLESRDA